MCILCYWFLFIVVFELHVVAWVRSHMPTAQHSFIIL